MKRTVVALGGAALGAGVLVVAGVARKHVDKILRVDVKLAPRDAWIGLYWDHSRTRISGPYSALDVYLCLVPFFPLHVLVRLHDRAKPQAIRRTHREQIEEAARLYGVLKNLPPVFIDCVAVPNPNAGYGYVLR